MSNKEDSAAGEAAVRRAAEKIVVAQIIANEMNSGSVVTPLADVDSQELKLCPFCGADGGIYYHGEDYSGSSQVDVGCTGGCHITPRAVGDTDPDAEQNEAWAINEWNTRSLDASGYVRGQREAWDTAIDIVSQSLNADDAVAKLEEALSSLSTGDKEMTMSNKEDSAASDPAVVGGKALANSFVGPASEGALEPPERIWTHQVSRDVKVIHSEPVSTDVEYIRADLRTDPPSVDEAAVRRIVDKVLLAIHDYYVTVLRAPSAEPKFRNRVAEIITTELRGADASNRS